jgi:hypothetical protein
MRVAFGTKAHSGWAALVVLGEGDDGGPVVVDRRRIELVEDERSRQPYHAAEPLPPEAAREVVDRGIAAAHASAVRELQAAVMRERARANEVAACAVLVGDPMPDWSVDEILAVHFRMHKAEGVLFREALTRATTACGVRLVAVPEKLLMAHATQALGRTERDLVERLTALGRSIGPPWGKDQKDAALAALVALQGRSS